MAQGPIGRPHKALRLRAQVTTLGTSTIPDRHTSPLFAFALGGFVLWNAWPTNSLPGLEFFIFGPLAVAFACLIHWCLKQDAIPAAIILVLFASAYSPSLGDSLVSGSSRAGVGAKPESVALACLVLVLFLSASVASALWMTPRFGRILRKIYGSKVVRILGPASNWASGYCS